MAAKLDDTPSACFNCCSRGGGYYKPYEGQTQWWIGLTADGQAHYACAECAPLLFDAHKLNCATESRGRAVSKLEDIRAVAYEVDAYANAADDVRYLLGLIDQLRAALRDIADREDLDEYLKDVQRVARAALQM